ncbi:MAG TPA: hypothetical protein VGE72_19300 [Azospirillum sp.]
MVQVEEQALEVGLQAQRFLNKRDGSSKDEMLKALGRLYRSLDGLIDVARGVNDSRPLEIAQRARRDAQTFAEITKHSLAAFDDNAKAGARIERLAFGMRISAKNSIIYGKAGDYEAVRDKGMEGRPVASPMDRALTGLRLAKTGGIDSWSVEGRSRLWGQRGRAWSRLGSDLTAVGARPL